MCDFPENIDESNLFKFKIGNNSKKYCAVCEAYTPVPTKHIKISINDIQNLNFLLLENLKWFGAIAQFEQMRVLRP